VEGITTDEAAERLAAERLRDAAGPAAQLR
jgi:hypothetical protein